MEPVSEPLEVARTIDRAVLLVQRSPELRERLAALVAEIPGTRLAGTAASTAEALLWLTALRFDAVLVDVAVLAPSRLEALQALRLAAPVARLVVLAADGDPEVRQRCRSLGADEVLGSAVEFERLGEVLAAPLAPPRLVGVV
jgi:DNA-binding NarL/FixJ family response regulator